MKQIKNKQPAAPKKARKVKADFSFKDGQLVVPENDRVMKEVCKTDNMSTATMLVYHASTGNPLGANRDKNLSLALSQMAELAPRSPLEAMLVSQMVAVSAAVGTLMDGAMTDRHSIEFREKSLNLATKLQRTFLAQVDALQKLRGKGQQTVRVEHVTVNAGGQAIVGNVEHKTGGEG